MLLMTATVKINLDTIWGRSNYQLKYVLFMHSTESFAGFPSLNSSHVIIIEYSQDSIAASEILCALDIVDFDFLSNL